MLDEERHRHRGSIIREFTEGKKISKGGERGEGLHGGGSLTEEGSATGQEGSLTGEGSSTGGQSDRGGFNTSLGSVEVMVLDSQPNGSGFKFHCKMPSYFNLL